MSGVAVFFFFFFFFQAEDGIRDRDVTGVQTCALPISTTTRFLFSSTAECPSTFSSWGVILGRILWISARMLPPSRTPTRSEERRVGKECRARGAPDH